MEQITYKQACDLLGVKYVTVKDAVLYGRLTRCAYPEKQAMLLKKQVELFKGKRISDRALSLEDRQKWEECKRIAENMKSPQLLPSSVNVSDEEYRLAAVAREAGRQGAAMVLTDFVKQIRPLWEDLLKDANIKVPELEPVHP